MNVIGISGKAGHGKDFTASIVRRLAEEEFGKRTCVWSLAHALKARAYAEAKGELSFTDVWYNKPPQLRKLLQEIGTEKGRLVFGEDFWLLQAEAFFKLFGIGAGVELIIVPDIRFLNEVEFVRYGGRAPLALRQRIMTQAAKLCGFDMETEAELLENDPTGLLDMESTIIETYNAALESFHGAGRCYRIRSDRPTLTGEAAQHLSEISLDNVPEETFDGFLENGTSTTEAELEMQIRAILQDYLGPKKEQ
jgi:hypothetical protein